jgi:DNA replication protein DnaC
MPNSEPNTQQPSKVEVNPMPNIQNPLATPWQRKWLNLEVTHRKLQDLATETQEYCKRFLNKSAGNRQIVIQGNSGNGKTHVARQICLWARQVSMFAYEGAMTWDHPPGSMFVSWPSIADGFKDGEFGVLQDLFTTDLLVLDDIGAESDRSQIATDKLCQVLSQRDKKHWTVITTNISPEVWPTKFDARVTDRLLRNSTFIELEGVPSYALLTFQRKAA